MKWTRLSFFYLITYLTVGGLGLLAAPEMALRLLFAQGSYPTSISRFVGALMLGLAIIVFQIVRLRVEALYSTTLVVRGFFVVVAVALYFESRDTLFLGITGIVSLGIVLTTIGWLTDRRRRGEGPKTEGSAT